MSELVNEEVFFVGGFWHCFILLRFASVFSYYSVGNNIHTVLPWQDIVMQSTDLFRD